MPNLKAVIAGLKMDVSAADAASAAKSQFLANMSHEIRSPLAVILGFSEALASLPGQSPENLDYIEPIVRNARMLTTLIGDILDLSKVEAGMLDIEPVDVRIGDLLSEIMTQLIFQASAKGILLTAVSDGPIPEMVTTDPLRFRQIVTNIVGNAIKFSDRGAIEMVIKLVRVGPASQQLEFKITDTGVGLTKAQAEKLFAPFVQADMTTTRKFGGTGLGLALSKRLANELGGDVCLLKSKKGVGSTFVISIGIGACEGVPLMLFKSSEMVQRVPIVPAKAGVCLIGAKALVVDDGFDNLMLMRHILKNAGATVDEARNGTEAIDMASRLHYDFILMDLQMPITDGYEATIELRKRGCKQPIIAMTAHAMKEVYERCLSVGFTDYVSKPIELADFLRKLEGYAPPSRPSASA